jgi:hypothetical protein
VDRNPRYTNGRIWGVLIPAMTAIALIVLVIALVSVFTIANARG